MTVPAPAIHIFGYTDARQPAQDECQTCRVCNFPLGEDPALFRVGKDSEWVCRDCMPEIEAALADVGRGRVRAWLGTK